MNDTIRSLLHRFRSLLELTDRGVLIGSIPAGARTSNLYWPANEFQVLSEIANGIQLGEVVIYRLEDLPEYQHLVPIFYPGQTEWAIIGHVQNNYILFHTRGGNISICRNEDGVLVAQPFASLADFIQSLFDSRYRDLVGYQDDWYAFVNSNS